MLYQLCVHRTIKVDSILYQKFALWTYDNNMQWLSPSVKDAGSQITHEKSSNIHSLGHMLGTYAMISVAAPFVQFTTTISCKGISPHSRWKATWAREGSPKEHRNLSKMTARNSLIYICIRALFKISWFNNRLLLLVIIIIFRS